MNYKLFKFYSVSLICILVFIYFSGCTSSGKLKTVELSREYRNTVKHISVSGDIKFACDDMDIYPFKYAVWGCCIGGPCGLVPGAFIDMARGNKYKKKLKKVADLNEILNYTLHKQFVSVLKDDKYFEYVDSSDENVKADAEIVFVIQQYGLISHEISGKTQSANIDVDVYLIHNPPYNVSLNADDKLESDDPEDNPIIFSKRYEWMGTQKGSISYTMDEYLENPELLGKVYNQACEIISKKILKDL